MNQQNIDYVLRSVEQRDIRFVRLWFVDILGRLKNFAISPEDLEVAFEEGIGFDGSAIEGFATPEEADMLAFPDASTFQILPWRPSHNGVARVFCDVCTPDRKPFAGDPRDALRRMFYKPRRPATCSTWALSWSITTSPTNTPPSRSTTWATSIFR